MAKEGLRDQIFEKKIQTLYRMARNQPTAMKIRIAYKR